MKPVRNIELVKKRSLWEYIGDDWVMFIKITVADPRSLPKVRDECLVLSCAAFGLILSDYAFSREVNVRSRISSRDPLALSKAILCIHYAL